MAKLDGRTKEAGFMRRLRKELLAQVGDNPSATQRLLVERAVRLSMQVELMDERFFEDGELSDRNGRQHLAYSNALSRTLARLGINPGTNAPAGRAKPSGRVMIEADIRLPVLVEDVRVAPPKTPRPAGRPGLGPSVLASCFDRKKDRPKPAQQSPSSEPGTFQTRVVAR